ncbi:metalloprotease [Tieghemiomyces parasiticus]|uniref:Metalloprotease n=1 Tax=Tieghemiomyces parasiticus TaxID=78921 RepID=A0A9W7ZVV7_9FUNG|nr:metalloprotease [Tieghemiomyces parasiticus]
MTAPIAPPPGFKLEYLSGDATLPYYVYQTPLDQSFSDDCAYRLIRLPNQLEALIVQAQPDEAVKSSAALVVQVGDCADPPGLPGLAHFCEHLLFLGTEKYPKEGEYRDYLGSHGGRSNAYTSMNHTNYYFTINSEYFEGALDRFAQFFIAPHFNQDCTDRELRAVDSEHNMYLQYDLWRVFQISRTLINPDHPLCNFNVGNLRTLKEIPERNGIDTRAELLKFYRTHYSANLMHLVVFGRDSLDQLTEWVVTKFHRVVNKDRPYPHYDTLPWKPEHLQRIVRIEATQTSRSLAITFPTKDFKPQYHCNPSYIVALLLRREGAGSLFAHLKQRGWVTRVFANSKYSDISGFDSFYISVDLTSEGLLHTDEIVEATFEYLHLLNDRPVPEAFFDQTRHMSQIRFRYRAKSEGIQCCKDLSVSMMYPWLQRKHLLAARNVLRNYHPDEIRDFLSYLTPDNFHVTILAKGLELVSPQTEEHYGTHYTVEPVPAEFLARLKAIDKLNPAFHLPRPNELIPGNLSADPVRPDGPRQTGAHLLRAAGAARLWYKKDDRFGLPHGVINLTIHSPLADASPFHAVRLNLLRRLWVDTMHEQLYNASEAGINVDASDTGDGIVLSIVGFNDKLPRITEYVLTQLRDFSVSPDRFVVMKEKLLRAYSEFQFSSSLTQAHYVLQDLWYPRLWDAKECLAAARDLTVEDLTAFHAEFVRDLCPETLVVGNFTEEQALAIHDGALSVLCRAVDPFVNPINSTSRTLVLPPGTRGIRQVTHPNADDKNVGVLVVFQIGMDQDFALRAHLQLAAEMMKTQLFTQLRTKETLGYGIYSDLVIAPSGVMYWKCAVQGERSPVYLEARIHTFLHDFVREVETMSVERFEKHRDALIQAKRQPPRSIGQEARQIFKRIQDGSWEFDRCDRDQANLRRLTQASLVAFFLKHLHPASPHLTKLSIHVFPARLLVTPTGNPDYNIDLAEQGVRDGVSTSSPGRCPYSLSFLALHDYFAHRHIQVPPADLMATLRSSPVRDATDTDGLMALLGPLVDKYYQASSVKFDHDKAAPTARTTTQAADDEAIEVPAVANGPSSLSIAVIGIDDLMGVAQETEKVAADANHSPSALQSSASRTEAHRKALADMMSDKVLGSFFDPQGIAASSPLVSKDDGTSWATAGQPSVYESQLRTPFDPYVVPMADHNILITDPRKFKSCLNMTSSVLPVLNFKPKY